MGKRIERFDDGFLEKDFESLDDHDIQYMEISTHVMSRPSDAILRSKYARIDLECCTFVEKSMHAWFIYCLL